MTEKQVRPLHLYLIENFATREVLAVTPGFDIGDAVEFANTVLGLDGTSSQFWSYRAGGYATHTHGGRVRQLAMELGTLEARIALYQSAQDGALFR